MLNVSDATFSAPMPHTERDHGIPAEDLGDQRFDVRQVLSICKCWKSVCAYNTVKLFLGFPLGLGIERHSKEEGVVGRYRLLGVSSRRQRQQEASLAYGISASCIFIGHQYEE